MRKRNRDFGVCKLCNKPADAACVHGAWCKECARHEFGALLQRHLEVVHKLNLAKRRKSG